MTTAREVECLAREKFGVDAAVVEQSERYYRNREDKGDWFVLSLKREGEWQVECRRRTLDELAEMVK